ncbi:MAG TPA: enoyl-CoA hydratase-related protein, partial [Acetobacteraceae bacterium]|nr:enoyl-CoA hydratase-related protein [Acetobacteraceae bacterium]
GLINRVVPDEQVDEEGLKIATELARGPRSLGLIRASAWAALETPLEEQLARERNFQRDAGRTEDFVEGVTSFREKRPAAFKGC